MAFPDDNEVQRTAGRCLRLYDQNPDDSGSLHVQAQRFLNPEWQGLDGNGHCGSIPDPPLRYLMEQLASGGATLLEFSQQRDMAQSQENMDPVDLSLVVSKHSLLYWVSSFRLVLYQHYRTGLIGVGVKR